MIEDWVKTIDFLISGAALENSELMGSPQGQCVSGCSNDSQAISMWLANSAMNTMVSYRKSSYRFLVWLHFFKSKSLGEVTFNDWIDYEEFLRTVPSEWVGRTPSALCDFESGYRFFKGKLDSKSIIQEKRALSSLFGWLLQTGYIVGNPFKADRRGGVDDHEQKLKSFLGHSRKSIDTELFRILRIYVDGISTKNDVAKAKKARLIFILDCLFYGGLRVSELCSLRTGAERFFQIRTGEVWPNDFSYLMIVVGKGGKVREVPMHQKVKHSFLRMRDTMALPLGVKNYEDIPVVMGINAKILTERRRSIKSVGEDAGFRADLKNNPGSYVGLQRQAIFKILKACYFDFSQWLERGGALELGVSEMEAKVMAEEIRSKNVHSLRHSFGTNMVQANGVDVTAALMGHSSPVTTMQYVSISGKDSYAAVSNIE